MNIQRLLSDHNIPFATPGDHHHVTSGWVNVNCPFCGGRNYQLGISEQGACHCWRCGGHSLVDVLCALLLISLTQAKQILQQHGNGQRRITPRPEPKVSIHPFRFPRPHSPLTETGKAYLSRRKFDAERLEKEWGLLQTGPISMLDHISYSHRIVIPIRWNGEIVSFQGRDITSQSDMRYLSCPKRREKIHLKHIIYGQQERWQDFPALIVVEGPTDVWRLGACAAAVLGIEFTMQQVLQLAKAHERFVILFDPEPQAQKQAGKLSAKLRALGKHAAIEQLGSDPGDLTQDDADHLVRELTGGKVK